MHPMSPAADTSETCSSARFSSPAPDVSPQGQDLGVRVLGGLPLRSFQGV